jgi:hypothetical protein
MYSHVEVEMPNSQWQFKRVYKAVIRQNHYEHDYLSITFRDWSVSPSRAKPGSLIRVKLDGKEFCGYIHDIKAHQEDGKDTTELGIIGASYAMRQSSQKVYYNVTADKVIIDIARRYNFAFNAVPHSRVYDQISQAGMTDWEFMVKLAKQSGYFLRADNASLHFTPISYDFKEYIFEAKSFVKSDLGKKYTNPLYSFKPIVGETLGHHGADKYATSIAGVDPITGSYFKYTTQRRTPSTRQISHPEMFDKHDTSVVANNFTTAVSEANTAEIKSSFAYMAEAEIMGDSSLRPGMPIHFANVGKEYSGYWTILSIEHDVKEESHNRHIYTTKLVVGSDSLGDVKNAMVPSVPDNRAIRHIKPNTRNTRKKVTTEVYWSGLNVRQPDQFALVNRTNRANSGSKTLLKSRWVSRDGNLISPDLPPQKPSFILEKIRNYNANQ